MPASNHDKWMKEALALARRGEGHTRPNPPVGAVVVDRGAIVGRGYHRKAGGAHAEVLALKAAGRRARGATLYVTLEPCSTIGRTPPCTELIAASGVARVVVSVRDPNRKHRGRGIRILKVAGLELIEGVCAHGGRELIAPFAKWITTGMPYLTLKMGMTLDGRIADASGRSKWITCPESRKQVHDLRRRADAVMIGGHTAAIDNPTLLPNGRSGADTYRVIVDTAGETPASAKALNDKNAKNTIMIVTAECPSRTRGMYESKGAEVIVLPTAAGGVSLARLMKRLGKKELLHVLCEGGGALAYSLIKAGLVDEFLFFVAPLVMGGKDSVPVVGGKGWKLTSMPRLKFTGCTNAGRDILIKAVPIRNG